MNTTQKVYRATKSYRNGERTKHFVILADDPSDFDWMSESAVTRWAELDPAGQNYGYDLKWELETDQELIDKAVTEELTSMEREIERLQQKLTTMKMVAK